MPAHSSECRVEKLILVTGMPGSGKSIFGEIARRKGLPVVNMGDIVREIAHEQGLEVNDSNLAKIAKELRDKSGRAAVAMLAYEKACKTGSTVAVIEGLRSLEELDYLRQNAKEAVVVAFHSSPKTRFNRLLRRARKDDPSTWEEFVERDRRELGFGIGSVIALADIMVVNEDMELDELQRKVENILNKLLSVEVERSPV
ncbi:MAG: dephospho-CoA kinase [Thermofilum sp. NZ13]|nr:MAG: dephospho-CoA kinase [Thermofilum sp. NZ13]